MHEQFSHLPEQMNVPIECSACGYMSSLLASREDLSDLCDCNASFRIYISDAGPYAGILESVLDNLDEPSAWAEAVRDDLSEE